MKKIVFCAFILGFNTLFSECEFDTLAGYRQDHLSWTIGFQNQEPNILSELQWKDLKIFEVASKLKIVADRQIYIRAFGSYGRILSGYNQDSDYDGNHRTKEFSRSKADASNGEIFDLSVAFGYQFQVCQNALTISPIAGYALQEQHVKQRRGVQIIGEFDELGPFSGLNSGYNARWMGPFIGIDMGYLLTSCIKLEMRSEYHFVNFKGIGKWNLRKEFYKDFKHEATGFGFLNSIGATYQINERIVIGFNLNYEILKAFNGRDRTYIMFFNAETFEMEPAILDTHLRSVKWHTFSALFSFGLIF